jgi:hypothetical protein
MDTDNYRWKTTEEEIPPNPEITTAEKLIKTLQDSVNVLKSEVIRIENNLKENKK